jgi:hypothetical protein
LTKQIQFATMGADGIERGRINGLVGTLAA